MINKFMEWIMIRAVRVIAGARSRWLGCSPSVQQRIYVANHSSHLDSLLVSSALPEPLRRRTRPVAAAEYWISGVLRQFLIRRVFRGVLLWRSEFQLNPLESVSTALREGDSLIFFPEGTRGPGRNLQPLKPGIFCLARRFPAVDIVPVWIDNSYRVLPKGVAVPLPARCSITFGSPLRWKPGQQQEDFLADVRNALEALRPG
jgi:1-acyl-sn-glycerol-3-phosphate acyltransferase